MDQRSWPGWAAVEKGLHTASACGVNQDRGAGVTPLYRPLWGPRSTTETPGRAAVALFRAVPALPSYSTQHFYGCTRCQLSMPILCDHYRDSGRRQRPEADQDQDQVWFGVGVHQQWLLRHQYQQKQQRKIDLRVLDTTSGSSGLLGTWTLVAPVTRGGAASPEGSLLLLNTRHFHLL